MEVKGHDVRAHNTGRPNARASGLIPMRGAQHFPGFMKISRDTGMQSNFPVYSGMVSRYGYVFSLPVSITQPMLQFEIMSSLLAQRRYAAIRLNYNVRIPRRCAIRCARVLPGELTDLQSNSQPPVPSVSKCAHFQLASLLLICTRSNLAESARCYASLAGAPEWALIVCPPRL